MQSRSVTDWLAGGNAKLSSEHSPMDTGITVTRLWTALFTIDQLDRAWVARGAHVRVCGMVAQDCRHVLPAPPCTRRSAGEQTTKHAEELREWAHSSAHVTLRWQPHYRRRPDPSPPRLPILMIAICAHQHRQQASLDAPKQRLNKSWWAKQTKH